MKWNKDRETETAKETETARGQIDARKKYHGRQRDKKID